MIFESPSLTSPLLEHGTFAAQAGTAFHVQVAPEKSIALTLASAKLLSMQAPGAARAPFSLIFRGPSSLYLPQGIYRLKHDSLGVQEFFLVPIAPDSQGSNFEAVFN